jgi:quinate/shikimate dehydrogenase (NAD+)
MTGTTFASSAPSGTHDGAPDRCVVGLIGTGIATSASPYLHEREADRRGLRYLYQVIDLDRLRLPAEAVGGLLVEARHMGFRGLNITHPCKQLVVDHLDGLSREAEVLGAVNTVVFDDGKAVGFNTDLFGFRESFVRGLPDAALGTVVLVGAGGGGSAVAHALVGLGAERLVVVDADPQRAAALAAQLPDAVAAPLAALDAHMAGADGVVNATPQGMDAYPGTPFPSSLLRPELWVADIVYRPLETTLLRRAAELGCRTLDGGGMVVFQAVESFRLFTGLAPDALRMIEDFAELA